VHALPRLLTSLKNDLETNRLEHTMSPNNALDQPVRLEQVHRRTEGIVREEVEMLKELEHKEPHGELQEPQATES